MADKPGKTKLEKVQSTCADYNKFAWLYNEEFGNFGCHLFEVFYRAAGAKIPDRARILDLCCGTGQLAKVLSDRGHRVTCLDRSAEMLQIAKRNAPDCDFILEDACNFQLPATFEAVFSTYDSLNHLISSKDLMAAFQNVYHCLAAKGFFLFDLNTLSAYKKQWKDYLEVVEKPDHLYVNRAYYDPKKRIGQTHCLIFQRRGENWQRSDIMLYQKCHSTARVELLLQQAGFVQIHKYGLNQRRGFHTFKEDDSRVFFVCRKP